jgi:hypothetical protein
MNRRSLLKLGGLYAITLPALAFAQERSKLKITGVRLVKGAWLLVDRRSGSSQPDVDLPRLQSDSLAVESRPRKTAGLHRGDQHR